MNLNNTFLLSVLKLSGRICGAMAIVLLILPLRAVAQTGRQWWPSTSTIILGGGHLSEATSTDLAKRLIALAGGSDALIVIIPTADNLLPPQVGRAEFNVC